MTKRNGWDKYIELTIFGYPEILQYSHDFGTHRAAYVTGDDEQVMVWRDADGYVHPDAPWQPFFEYEGLVYRQITTGVAHDPEKDREFGYACFANGDGSGDKTKIIQVRRRHGRPEMEFSKIVYDPEIG